MSKIYLLTPFQGFNYGTRLQAISLYKYFQEQGNEIAFFNSYRAYGQMLRHPRILLNRFLYYMGSRRRKRFFKTSPYIPTPRRVQRLGEYDEKLGIEVANARSSAQWKEIVGDECTFVVGGDIVWNPAAGWPGKWVLDFTDYDSITRFSYGTSVGADSIPRRYWGAFRRALSKFSYIGVREKSAATMLESILHRPVDAVLDPVLLHGRDWWEDFASNAEFSSPLPTNEYVLCYFVMDDPNYLAYVSQLVETTGLSVVMLPMHQSQEVAPYTVLDDTTPFEFVSLIRDAQMICTDSFHACAFSLLFEKDLHLLRRKRKTEDSKYDAFLKKYGLENCRIDAESKYVELVSPDYRIAQERLETDRARSLAFLEKAMQG